jgi:hypothetical protein
MSRAVGWWEAHLSRADVAAQFDDEEAVIVFESPAFKGPVVAPTYHTGDEETTMWVQDFGVSRWVALRRTETGWTVVRSGGAADATS